MKRLLLVVLLLSNTVLFAATGTPSTLVVRVDANGYLVVTAATQTNPITSGVFSSRVLKTDASGNLQVILAGTVTPTYPMSIPASTCAAPSLGESGATTTGIAFTATPSILMCISGTARTTLTASSFTSIVPILLPDGTVAAPASAFSNDQDTGLLALGGGAMGFAGNGVGYWYTQPDLFNMKSTMLFGWSSGSYTSSTDTQWAREAVAHIFQRNSTNAQRASWANTYTSSTNYEAFSVDWQTVANTALVGTRTAATGTSRPLRLIGQNSNAGSNFATINLDAAALPIIKAGLLTSALANVSDNSAGGTYFSWGNVTNTGTSGTIINTSITPTYNQSSGSAANTDFLINRTETAIGSGAQLLIDAAVASASKFSVTRTGVVTSATSFITTSFLSPLGTNMVIGTQATGTDNILIQTRGTTNFTINNGQITAGANDIYSIGAAASSGLNSLWSYRLRGAESTAPAAPAADNFVIYAEDNGAGKTRICALFSSGAAQCFATQP